MVKFGFDRLWIMVFIVTLMELNVRLDGAIGCINHVHTVDRWDNSQSVYQDCACDCVNPEVTRGYCAKCGHFGRVDRGQLTARAEKLALKPFRRP